MSRLLRLVAALVCLAAPAFAQQQIAPPPGCPPNASNCTVTATGGNTARSLANWWGDFSNSIGGGAAGNGSTNDSAVLTSIFGAAAGKPVYFSPGTYLLNTDVSPTFADSIIQIAPSSSFTGTGLLRFDNLIPYQVGPVFSRSLRSATYGSGYNVYANIFQSLDYVQATGTTPTVASFGEGEAVNSGSQAWGGNFVCAADVSAATCFGAEFDSDAFNAGSIAYGIMVAASGTAQSQAAIRVQGNNSNASFINGIYETAYTRSATLLQPFTGAGLDINNVTAQRGIYAPSSTFTIGEIDFPSFLVGPTVSSINSRIEILGDAGGNPTIKAVGTGGTPATNSNVNIQALGSGSIQFLTNNIVALTIKRTPASAIGTSAFALTPSALGSPAMSIVGASGTPATNADMDLTPLGTGNVVVTSGSVQISALSSSLPVCTDGSKNLSSTCPAGSGSGAPQTVTYQPGLLTAVNATIGVFKTFVKASTVDNLVGSAVTFSCVANPTVTLYECGTSSTCATPTTIGTVTVTAAGTRFTGTVSSPAIAAGDSIGWAITAGTCASIDIAGNAEVHAN